MPVNTKSTTATESTTVITLMPLLGGSTPTPNRVRPNSPTSPSTPSHSAGSAHPGDCFGTSGNQVIYFA